MKINQITCGNCGGRGYATVWNLTFVDEMTGMGTMNSEEVKCGSCNGNGWIEYAVFSVEEAKAILKHCGLNTED